uniref:Uncharacterized protein n=1 Tax=Ditylenchus dipsaci TaxID=166011 RepID=A0A915EFH8_9BILA
MPRQILSTIDFLGPIAVVFSFTVVVAILSAIINCCLIRVGEEVIIYDKASARRYLLLSVQKQKSYGSLDDL